MNASTSPEILRIEARSLGVARDRDDSKTILDSNAIRIFVRSTSIATASHRKIFQKIIALRSLASYRTRVSYKRGNFLALMGHVAVSRKEEIPRTAQDDGDQNPNG
jgi:hypothetical protein